MAFKKEEFESLIQREGLMDFIWVRSWKDVPNTNIGLFEMENERWGCIFEINPSVYAGAEAEKRLSNFFNSTDLPGKSSVQIVSFASRNVTSFMDMYRETHSGISNIEHKEALNELREDRLNWIKKHSNESIFQTGNDLRIRNFINLVAITIPRKKENGDELTESEIISYFSKAEQGLSDFMPTKFTSRQWVILVRELLVPDNPLWFPPEDHLNSLNFQVVDNNSTMTLEDNGVVGIGTILNEKEIKEIEDSENISISKIEEEEEMSIIKKLFSRNKKKENLGIYTKWKMKTFTTKMFPYQISMHDITGKFYDYFGKKTSPTIPCPFYLSLIVYLEDRESTKKEVSEKAKWDMWQTDSLGEATRFFPEIRERAEEAESINYMLHNGITPMFASWSITLMDQNEKSLNSYAENLKKEFLRDNWILQEENLIPHWIFLYHLPLNFEPYVLKDLAKRMNTLFSSNCAAITPLVTGDRGYGDPVLTYIDRGGQISGCDIFASKVNYNFIVIGSTGSGKSYNMVDFFKNYLMTGAKIRVIDVGRSYKEFCDVIGGQYIEFTEEAAICLNFFTNIQLDDHNNIHEDELQTIVPLIGLMAMQSIDSETAGDIKIPVIKSRISEAVVMAFKSRQRNAGMQDVVEALEQIALNKKNETGEYDQLLSDLIVSLYPFGHPDGEYYKYFNGDNNLQFNSDFVVLELEEIDSKQHLKSVVLAAISHVINTEFFLSGDRSQKKILAIDEAWSIMKNKIVMSFLETVARRIRKYYGGLGVITQTFADFYKNDATRAIFDSSSWKFFLQQSKDSILAAKNAGELNLEPIVLTLLESIKSNPPMYSEVLVKQDSGAFFIGRLITDKTSHWIATNHPNDLKEVNRVIETFKIGNIDARLIIGNAEANKTSYQEEFNKRLSEGLILT